MSTDTADMERTHGPACEPGQMCEPAKRASLIATGVGAVAILALVLVDYPRAMADFLVMYTFVLTAGLGSLFLVALEYTVHARWSVPFRRISENLSALILVSLVLVIPVLVGMTTLYEWTHAEAVAHDHLLHEKAPYLNLPFFFARLAFYYAVWIGSYLFFTKGSRAQDDSRDPAFTFRARRFAPVALILFAVTTTFAAIDFIMSLTPHWYSTSMGVYFFSGAIVAGFALTTFVASSLKVRGMLPDEIHRDHFYNLGAMMFAMNVFWAYIAFTQYMLIWYGNLPEELAWYHLRGSVGWILVAGVLIVGHFLIPFSALLSRSAKMNVDRLRWVSAWLLGMHWFDLMYMILPSVPTASGEPLGMWCLLDYGFLLFAVGVMGLVWWWRVPKSSLLPVGDPRLDAGLEFHL